MKHNSAKTINYPFFFNTLYLFPTRVWIRELDMENAEFLDTLKNEISITFFQIEIEILSNKVTVLGEE